MPRAAGGGGHGSLRRTFLAVALVSILPFVALFAYFGYAQIGREKGRVQQEGLSQARALATQLEGHLTARVEGIGTAADAIATGGATPAIAEAQARRLRQSFPDFDQVLVLDPVGSVIAAAGGQAEGRRPVLGDQDWFKRAATSTQPFIGEPRLAAQDVVVGIYTAVRTTDNQFRGVVAGDLNLRRFQDLLARARLREGIVAEVVTERGVVVARHPSLFLMQTIPGGAESRQEGREITFADGEVRLGGAATIRPVGWVLAIGHPSAQVFADTRALLLQVGVGVAAIAILSLGLSLSMAKKTGVAIARLRTAMTRLQAGDLPGNVPVMVGGEIGALTEGFNRVVGWLRAKLRDYEALSQVEEAAGAAIGSDRSVSAVLPELLRK